MGKHKDHSSQECVICPFARVGGAGLPQAQGGILGGLFGGDNNLLLIILLVLFFFCFCGNRDGTAINLGDAPLKLLETYMKSRGPATT